LQTQPKTRKNSFLFIIFFVFPKQFSRTHLRLFDAYGVRQLWFARHALRP
jgi:hypothetical protein